MIIGTLLKERIETKLNKAGFKIPVGDTSAEVNNSESSQVFALAYHL